MSSTERIIDRLAGAVETLRSHEPPELHDRVARELRELADQLDALAWGTPTVPHPLRRRSDRPAKAIGARLRSIVDAAAQRQPQSLRGDREVALGAMRLPVHVDAAEPIELVGIGLADTLQGGEPRSARQMQSLTLELHNPSHAAYHAHGRVLIIDDHGDAMSRHEFDVDAIDPYGTATTIEPIDIPHGACKMSVVVTTGLAS